MTNARSCRSVERKQTSTTPCFNQRAASNARTQCSGEGPWCIGGRQLSFSDNIYTVAQKTNKIMAVIKGTFVYLDFNSFKLLFKAIVRPHLEYGVPVWYPYKKKEKECIKDAQRRATQQIKELKNLTYEERLKRLDLQRWCTDAYEGTW